VNESWANVDVLIYTTTLTAGVSFELERFDVLIGVYIARTGGPTSFI